MSTLKPVCQHYFLVHVLALNHYVVMCVRILKRLCQSSEGEITQTHLATFLQTEIAGNGQMQGYQWLRRCAIRLWGGYAASLNICLILQVWSKGVHDSARHRQYHNTQFQFARMWTLPQVLWRGFSISKLV